MSATTTGLTRTRSTTIASPSHAANIVLNQPALPTAQWEAEVSKMRTSDKAPIVPKDVDATLDYLVSMKGVKQAEPD